MYSSTRYKPVPWANSTNIYEVNLRQYTQEGTINAFLPHLPRLKDMGVQTLWFMPITPIAQKNMKGTMGSYYACSDFTDVAPEFGTMEDFRNLVAKAHEMGFKVILDWVANHTGWDHRWTWTNPEYFEQNPITNAFVAASGMDDIIELNFKNPSLRAAMIDAMKWWVTGSDIDGFRCDLAFWVELDFWKEARPALDAVKPLFWLGEFDELEHPAYGEVFDASYSWSWMHHAAEYMKAPGDTTDLMNILKRYDDLGDHTMRAWFTSNHDENSWNGTEFEKYGPLAPALAVFSSTWNGIPLLYSGQELPNTKRLAFFDKDPIGWDGTYQLHGFYQALLRLHTEHPALRGGDTSVRTIRVKTNAGKQILAFLRRWREKEVLVFLNFTADPLSVEISDNNVKGAYRDVFSNEQKDLGTIRDLTLEPFGYFVFEK